MTDLGGAFLVRHAPVAQNNPAHERLRGQSNPPVNREGREVAKERAAFFDGMPIRRIFHDGLTRSRVMAEMIRKVTGGQVIQSKGPISWAMGELEGQLADKAEKILDRYMFIPDNRSSDIPGGESFDTFRTRWLGFLQTHRRDHGTVVVTHLRNLITAAGWAEAGGTGLRVDLKKLRNYEPFKKVEIALLTPKGEFIITRMAAEEKEMVHA